MVSMRRSTAAQALADDTISRDGYNTNLFNMRLHYPVDPSTESLVT